VWQLRRRVRIGGGVSTQVAEVVATVAAVLFGLWWFPSRGGARWLGARAAKVLWWVRQELHPFAFPLVVVRYVATVWAKSGDGALINTNAVLGFLVGVLLWWLCRNDRDDDDRWKRRRRRAGKAVRAVAGRLVVVPAAVR
jgi:hypothetical protein